MLAMANMANISNMSSTRPGWLGWQDTRSNISGWFESEIFDTHLPKLLQDPGHKMHTTWKVANVRRHFTDSKRQKRHMTRDTWQTRWCILYENGTAYGTHIVHQWYAYVTHMLRILYSIWYANGSHMFNIRNTHMLCTWYAYFMHMVCIWYSIWYVTNMAQGTSTLQRLGDHYQQAWLWSTHTMHIKSGQFLHICGSKLFSYNFCPHICPSMYICTYILHIYLHIYIAHTFTYLFRMLLYTCSASHVNVF